MVVEMVGMCFNGYMIGTFQTLISSMGSNDQFTELQETLDQNLMRLDKSVKDRILAPSIYIGVKEFYLNKHNKEAMNIQKCEFFQQLKPRLQKDLLDIVFASFYE